MQLLTIIKYLVSELLRTLYFTVAVQIVVHTYYILRIYCIVECCFALLLTEKTEAL